MPKFSLLWRSSAIVFASSFCVMVIELIASRMLAPYIGVSLYSWTSIIGIILAGIAMGNYSGGKIADKYPSYTTLVIIFFLGALATIAILPITKWVVADNWLDGLPIMWDFTLRTFFIFFLPAFIISMVSPMVIKLTLADLDYTGHVVGIIYAYSTAGSILGTFMTGFYLILWFGTRTVIWIVAAVLFALGIIIMLWGGSSNTKRLCLKNLFVWFMGCAVVLSGGVVFEAKEIWQETYTKESNYYAIKVGGGDIKVLYLDNFDQSYLIPDEPKLLIYKYLNVIREIFEFVTQKNPAPRVLHLGGGAYCFPRYVEIMYPGSINEVIEIDPAVTQVVHEELGLPYSTGIKTYNQDARRFLVRRNSAAKYDIVIGDVFNDQTTPYHLTTREFNELVKVNLKDNGIYIINITDNYVEYGRYMASFIHTLRHTFKFVWLFSTQEKSWSGETSDYVIMASDRHMDLEDYEIFITRNGKREAIGTPHDMDNLDYYIAAKKAILLTDDYAPTDILVAPLFK